MVGEMPILSSAEDANRIELSPEQVSLLSSLGGHDLYQAFQLPLGVSESNGTLLACMSRATRQTRAVCDNFRV